MCSRGMSRLLWSGRPGTMRRDYISYGTRARTGTGTGSGTSSHYRYSRPPTLHFTPGDQSGVYYGSRYHLASSFAGPDPWTPPPRVRSFADSYSRGDHTGAYYGRGSQMRSDSAADGRRSSRDSRDSRSRRHSKHDAPPPSPRRKSHGKHVRFSDIVRCYRYRTEKPRQNGTRDEDCEDCRRGDYDYDRQEHRERRERRERRTRREQRSQRDEGEYEYEYAYSKSGRRPRDSYEQVYNRSPREAAADRNRSRYEEASQEDTRRRKRRGSGRRRSVEVEVDVRY